MADTTRLRLGTRASALAQWQAKWVADRLSELGVEVELVNISTQGDQQQIAPIGDIGTVGVFTKEIQRAVLEAEVDVAVHSLKDLPTEATEGLTLAAIPQRESSGDALVTREAESLAGLPSGARVGTGSLRRQAQLLHQRKDLNVAEIRGNVDTRIRKLDEGDFDAIVLAEAGLKRLGLAQRITQIFPKQILLPAVGQGALGIECREDDEKTRSLLAQLDEAETRAAVIAERALLAELRGGCMAPVGAWGRIERDRLLLTAAVLSRDGSQKIESSGDAEPSESEELGRRIARELLDQGAAVLIESSRTG